MLRITEIPGDEAVARLKVEGRLTRQTVAQLHSSSSASLAASGTLLLDVSGVRFVDREGGDTLRDLTPKGTVLIGCSGLLTEMLRTENGAGTESSSRDAEPPDETELVSQLRRGDEAAFERIVREHGGRMLATARRMLRSEDEARDVVQEAFLSAFKAIGTFGGSARLSTWLHRIVVNCALMRLRSQRRRPEESIDTLLPRFDEKGEWAGGMASDNGPSMLVERQQTRLTVRRCIDQLPESYGTVIILRDIEELDTDEAAAILHVSPNAVKIRLHRARQALRTLLERELGRGDA